ncbi:hypothetical protein [Leptolyngbya iicbica]|uniref:Uncharacterized protein n=2 Tax=Cyanophyceae TaxID=3028117 RepID=A0A4Q7EG21_9CYAN|nr:hypothetical protein [Leptolyngbya sp. LK]RZM82213.1 hypothetical protein DYY88_02880 [Leptolyngbya sp. LK]
MKKSELIKLAQQGHPQAIALLLNHSLQSQNIQATVGEHAGTLHIVLESQPPPAQATYSKAVHQGLQKLAIAAIDKAHIYGRTTGHREFAWKTVVSLRENTVIDQSQFTLSPSRFTSPEPSPNKLSTPPRRPPQQPQFRWQFWISWLLLSLGSSAIAFTVVGIFSRYLKPHDTLTQRAMAALTLCIVGSIGLLIQSRPPHRHP